MDGIREPDPPFKLEPWHGQGTAARRYELAKQSMPVFRRYGFRGATIKALAHACHLSPAALYHYFPSKAALATYLIDLPLPDWDAIDWDADTDPLVHVRQLLDSAILELADYMLAFDLALEIGRPGARRQRAAAFESGLAMFGARIAAATSTYTRDDANELGRRLMAILVEPHATGLDPSRAATRERAVDLLRLHLVPAGVDRQRFDAVMAPSD